ncbi:sensor histidine kinase [Marinoscillum sp.]|uniref:PorY family sensor histidine kinase n=1 Tax=Marinoscillum sp. TaxID=2024838 RepID=UPI003BACB1EA
MKLLDIANRYYLITLVLVFVIGSLGAYYVLKSIINHEFNQKLYAERAQIVYELRNFENLQRTYYLNIGDVIELEEVPEDPQLEPFLKDTIMYDQYEEKELPFRQLTFSDQINNQFYIITISKSLLSNLDLIQGVSEIMIGMALILMLSLGFLNRLIFQKLWSPFHHMIQQLQDFKISEPVPLKMEDSNVDEFNQLGYVLDEMITKNIKDYKNLKEYTENTSHEIQTPLAIIKNKAEMLLQEPLNEQQLTEVSKIYEAATRLARLKDGLSLLTKIENNQYIKTDRIDLKPYLENKLASFEELIELKSLQVDTEYRATPVISMNADLAYILITNLISNAIKHNVHGGWIKVDLDEHQLVIKNTGNELLVPTEELFERFKRNSDSRESTGLGLSLIQRICDQSKIKISYVHEGRTHELRLSWN